MKTWKQIFLNLFLGIVVTGCASGTTSTPQVAPAITVSPTLASSTPISPALTIEPSPTTDPNKPVDATGKDALGNWIQTQGDLTYTYNKETGKFTREVGSFSLWDEPSANYLPLTIRVNSDVKGAQYLVTLSHTDITMEEYTRDRSIYPTPLESEIVSGLFERLGISGFSGPKVDQLYSEMDKGKDSKAMLPFISSTGEALEGTISTQTGFIMDVVNPADLIPFIGKGVTKWKDPNGAVFFSTVTGIDKDGNILGKIAYEGDIKNLSDKQVRWMLFSTVGNVISWKDQKVQSMNTWTDIFAQASAKTLWDGTKDVSIVFNP